MFELPNYTGCDPEYVKSSLTFLNYHVDRTMRGKDRTAALEKVRTKAAERGINLENNKEDS